MFKPYICLTLKISETNESIRAISYIAMLKKFFRFSSLRARRVERFEWKALAMVPALEGRRAVQCKVL